MPSAGNQQSESAGNYSGHDERAASGQQSGGGASFPGLNRRRFLQTATASGAAIPLVSQTASAGGRDGIINVWNGLVDEEWRGVDLQEQTIIDQDIEPIALAGPPSYSGSQPCHCRISGVIDYGFEVQVEEWDYLNGYHYDEKVNVLHFGEGPQNTEEGEDMDGKLVTCDDYDWTYVDLADGHFEEKPVVISGVQSNNGPEAVVTRNANVDTEGFYVKMQEQENRKGDGDGDGGVGGGHRKEDVGVLAIEPGRGHIDGKRYEAGFEYNGNSDRWELIAFDQQYTDPVFIADLQTIEGGDPCNLRYRNLTSDSVEVKVEEERSKDDETSHVTETVGYIVVENETMYLGDRKTVRDYDSYYEDDGWETVADFNYGVGLTYHDDDHYQLGVGAMWNYYIQDTNSDDANGEIGASNQRLYATLSPTNGEDDLKTGTSVNTYKDLTKAHAYHPFIDGTTEEQWVYWYNNELGNTYSADEIKNELQDLNYDTDNSDAWLDVMMFVGALAMYVKPSLGVWSIGLDLVGGRQLAERLAYGSDGHVLEDDNPEEQRHHWDYEYEKALLQQGSRIDVNIGQDQAEPVDLHIKQMINPEERDNQEGLEYDIENDKLDVDTALHWKIRFPVDGSKPRLINFDRYYFNMENEP